MLVGLVATCVQLYSPSYLRDDPRYPSYAALVSLFTAAMLLVVYSGDLMVLLVGWEVMGICSYFLVGHYWETEAARAASIKAFLVTKLGDVPFLIGVFALAHRRRHLPDQRHPRPRPPTASSHHPTVVAPAAARRGRRQVRAVPAAHLAARRHGRPHPGVRADPRRHHGRRRHLPGGPAAAGVHRVGRRPRRARPRWPP